MRKSKVNLEDVARAAGVSIATVDRVINRRGGVRPDKEERILEVARGLGLDRSLSHRPARSLRVGVLLQSAKNPFHAALREGLALANQIYSGLNLQLFIQQTDPRNHVETAEKIRQLIGNREALIASLPDDPGIAAALARFGETAPVVTLVTDIAQSERRLYVGADDYKSGRVAGDLMGLLLQKSGGEVLMMGGLAENAGQRARQEGFRALLAERHPAVHLVEVIDTGEDGVMAGRLLTKALLSRPNIRGIYQVSTGTLELCQALERMGRDKDMVVIAHDLTPPLQELLTQRRIHAVIDQKPALEARLAFEAVARLLGRLDTAADSRSPSEAASGAAAKLLVETQIFMPESL